MDEPTPSPRGPYNRGGFNRQVRAYIEYLVLERAQLQRTIHELRRETQALKTRLERAAQKDTFRDMEGM